MTPRFVGIAGRKGAGKDAAATGLVDIGFQRTAFADALKVVCMELYGLSYEQCYGSIADKEKIDPRWGMSAREILQKSGTEGARKAVHIDTWVNCLFRDVEDFEERGIVRFYDPDLDHWTWIRAFPPPDPDLPTARRLWVIPDVRFDNEVDAIHARDGIVVRVTRPGFGTGVREGHDSETGIDQLDVDWTFTNDGTLEELKAKFRAIIG